jgi:serine/threonine protein kinase
MANNALTGSMQHMYSTSMDVFAMGCIVAELFRLRPLLPGQNELDQLQRIIDLLGPLPTAMLSHSDGSVILPLHEHPSPGAALKCPRTRVEESLTNMGTDAASFEAKSFVFQALVLDPNERLTSEEALKHDFLCDVHVPGLEITSDIICQNRSIETGKDRRSAHLTTPDSSPSTNFSCPEVPPTSHVESLFRSSEEHENVTPCGNGGKHVLSVKSVDNPNKRVALATPNTLRPTPGRQIVSASPQSHFGLRIHDNSHLL